MSDTTTPPPFNAQAFTQKITGVLARCAVPTSTYSLSEVRPVKARLNCTVVWKFNVFSKDVTLPPNEKVDNVLSYEALKTYTEKTIAGLRQDQGFLRNFLDKLEFKNLSELLEFARERHFFEAMKIYGMIDCKSCGGAGHLDCNPCKGLGKVPCPDCRGEIGLHCLICHSTGFVKCSACNGKGASNCKICMGSGLNRVERTVLLEVQGVSSVSAELGTGAGRPPVTEFGEEDRRVLFDNASLRLVGQDAVGEGIRQRFEGEVECLRASVAVAHKESPFYFTACGSGHFIIRPEVVDYFLTSITQRIERMSSGTYDIDERIRNVEEISQYGFIVNLLQQIEPIGAELSESTAVKYAVSADRLTDERYIGKSRRLMMARAEFRSELIRRVARLIDAQSYGFISPEFAGRLARVLINVLPSLNEINPNSEFLWILVITGTSVFALLWCIFLKGALAVGLLLGLTGLVAAGTSFFVTKNLVLYSVLSDLHLTHRGRSVPSLKPEAVFSMKLFCCVILTMILTYAARAFIG